MGDHLVSFDVQTVVTSPIQRRKNGATKWQYSRFHVVAVAGRSRTQKREWKIDTTNRKRHEETSSNWRRCCHIRKWNGTTAEQINKTFQVSKNNCNFSSVLVCVFYSSTLYGSGSGFQSNFLHIRILYANHMSMQLNWARELQGVEYYEKGEKSTNLRLSTTFLDSKNNALPPSKHSRVSPTMWKLICSWHWIIYR